MTVGDAVCRRIDEYMRERSMNLYKIAALAGLPQSTIYNMYRRHTKSPNMVTVMMIARGLGVSLHEFLREDLFNNDLELE